MSQNEINFKLLCRLCLKNYTTLDLVPIFGDEECIKVVDQIYICCCLQVTQGDGLPENICKLCNSKLNEFCTFRSQCQVADETIHELIKNSNNKMSEKLDHINVLTFVRNENYEWNFDLIKSTGNISSLSPKFLEKSFELDQKNKNKSLSQPPGWNDSYSIVNESRIPALPVPDLQEICDTKEEKNKSILRKSRKLLIGLPGLKRIPNVEKIPQTNIKLNRLKNRNCYKKKGKSDDIAKGKTPTKDAKDLKVYSCKFCDKQYPSEGGWRYHLYTIHSQKYQPFICDLCGKSFKVKKNLEGHKNSVHLQLKQHLCDLCGRGFATKYALKVHTIWHSGEKNFTCDVCGHKFLTQSKLTTHKLVHGGPKNFMCDVCSNSFRWKKDFLIHMRCHTGERPYPCNRCSKAFTSSTNLKKHEKSHKENGALRYTTNTSESYVEIKSTNLFDYT